MPRPLRRSCVSTRLHHSIYTLMHTPRYAPRSTAASASVDSAVVTRDPAQIALYCAHFDLLAKQAQPLMESCPRRLVGRFDQVQVESELRSPDRLLVKYAPSVSTEPADFHRETSFLAQRMREMGYTGAALRQRLARRHERLLALLAHAEATDARDSCAMQAIDEIVRQGWYVENAQLRPTTGAPVAERRLHLHPMIAVLQRYPHVQLALLDEQEAHALQVTRETVWEILGQQRVLINACSIDSDDQPVDLDITLDEPHLVAAFVAHFESLWQRIAPAHRDKQWVIAWLTARLRESPRDITDVE